MPKNVEFKSSLGEVLSAVKQQLEVAAEIIGGKAETYAKESLTASKAVDTGLLRNSVTHGLAGGKTSISTYKADKGDGSGSYDGNIPKEGKKDSVTIVVGTNVEYAPYIELGRGKMIGKSAPRPYIRPAIEDHTEEYKNILKSVLGG